MPSPEPNKEMEDLLKAYATRRREQGSHELPPGLRPASRAKLQSEMRRAIDPTAPPPAAVAEWHFRAPMWLRVVAGGGFAAVVIFFVVMSTVPNSQKLSAPASTRSATLAADSRVKSGGQQFVQVNNTTALESGAPKRAVVLATFQVERHGRDVVVLDGDGSVYKGTVVEAVDAVKAVDSRERSVAVGGGARFAGENRDDAGNYSFTVSGRNKDLKQNIVFIGNMVQMPQSEASTLRAANSPVGTVSGAVALDKKDSLGRGSQMAPAKPGQPAPASNQIAGKTKQDQNQQNLRVTGKVQVEGGGEFEIEAQPPGP